MKDLIKCFLSINGSPSDQQIHQLADAVGMDKETLESAIYEMLSDCLCDGQKICAKHRLEF